MKRGFAGPQGALKLEGPKWRQGAPHIKQPAGGSSGALASLGEAAPSLRTIPWKGLSCEQPAGNTWTECLCPEEVIWEHTKAFSTVPLRLQVPESICQQPGTIFSLRERYAVHTTHTPTHPGSGFTNRLLHMPDGSRVSFSIWFPSTLGMNEVL